MRAQRRTGPDGAQPQAARTRRLPVRRARAEAPPVASRALGPRLLVPGVFRTGIGLRPGQPEDQRRPRRRPLPDQRQQALDHACAPRKPHVRPRPHRRRRQAQRRDQLSPGRHGSARRDGAADHDARRRPRGQPGLSGQRRLAGRGSDRRGGAGPSPSSCWRTSAAAPAMPPSCWPSLPKSTGWPNSSRTAAAG